MTRPRYVSGPVPHLVSQDHGHLVRELRWWWRCPTCGRVSMA
ncbi:MAG: hypothetical protein UY40_C0020G0001, partial [candidate division CPR1 bacterium GW2011_GWC1_49_13]